MVLNGPLTFARIIIVLRNLTFLIKAIAFSLFSLRGLGFQILATKSSLADPGQILAARSWLPDTGYQILATRS